MEYLPDALRPYREMQAAMAGQQSLFEELWQAVDRGLDDQFLGSAGTYGLSRWETMLRLPARATDSLAARRSRIQARLNEQPPFTLRALRFQLDTLCGEGNCTAELAEGGCVLRVRLSLALKSLEAEVRALLERVTPLAVRIDFSLEKNTHALLGSFRHRELGLLTHDTMRNEVIAHAGQNAELSISPSA